MELIYIPWTDPHDICATQCVPTGESPTISAISNLKRCKKDAKKKFG